MINVVTLFDVVIVVKDISKKSVESSVPSGKAKVMYFVLNIKTEVEFQK